jgi:cellulose synthase/poly-beta-1,6-N-acetylglucosamine synthase-like glycosyltransferase
MNLGDPTKLEWHFFVPCRDEQAVIGRSLTYLRRRFPAAHIWVIDDDSDDRTATVVRNLRRIEGPNIHLVQRYRPQARTGKADALNAGYRALKAWQGRHAAPERAVVVVLDAGSPPLWNCLTVTAKQFEDPRMGSVQIDVRTGNTGLGWFRRLTARRGGPNPLSGNGQFIRLSALDSIAGPEGRPWSGRQLSPDWFTGHTRDTYLNQRPAPRPRPEPRAETPRLRTPVPVFDH